MTRFIQQFLMCLFFFNTLSISFAGPLEFYYHHHHQKKSMKLKTLKAAKVLRFNQLIHHKDPSMGTFPQRYFIDETYGKTNNAPVFLFLCGEGTCSQDELDGAIINYAKKFHAKLVALEHRYYGKSLPFKSLSNQHLRYLTTEEAIEDIAFFQNQISQHNNWTGKWVAFGGSYPGSLAAFYRLKHPELVVGALASSAPVRAKEDFIEYDTIITQTVGPDCAKDMQETVKTIEDSLNDPAQLDTIKTLFNAADVDDPIDFLSLVADVGAIAVQYGNNAEFCESLASGSTPLEGYALAAKKLFKEMGISGAQISTQVLVSDDPKDYNESNDWLRQWYYQTCTEYGYEQNANPDRSKSTRSIRINTKYQHQVCHQLFKVTRPPYVDLINNTYYLPLINGSVSNIYFTNGDKDPWSSLSLIEQNGNTTNPNLTYHLIEGGSHCVDMSSPKKADSKSLIKSRRVMHNLLAEWLKD